MTNYEFIGDWSDKEKKVVETKIKKHVPEQAQAGFNRWQIHKMVGRTWVNFSASKRSWRSSQLNASSAEELAEKLKRHYEAYEAVKVVQDDQ